MALVDEARQIQVGKRRRSMMDKLVDKHPGLAEEILEAVEAGMSVASIRQVLFNRYGDDVPSVNPVDDWVRKHVTR